MTYIRLSKGTFAELAVLERFQELGYEVRASSEIRPGVNTQSYYTLMKI